MSNLFSTEQVSRWHPDKYADQISDAIVNECLAQDPDSHVACECMVKGDVVVLGGEITTKARFNVRDVVGAVALKLGYKVSRIEDLITKQSPEINLAVGSGKDTGAGDQGMMFGYATRQSRVLLPFGFYAANSIIGIISKAVKNDPDHVLLGDAKCQVTEDLDSGSIAKILISVCHSKDYSVEDVREYVTRLIRPDFSSRKIELMINPAGAWTFGGPSADCGLTGRKIVCDQYGGYAPVGGGAFSGKDPSKVDRTGAYMARLLACLLLKRYGNAVRTAVVQLSYAIGVAEPVGVSVKLNNPSLEKDARQWIRKYFDLTPDGITNLLGIKHWNLENVSEGCHFLSEDFLTLTDKVEA